MRTRIWGYLLFILSLLTGTAASAQSSTAGKDFWLSFPQNAKYEFGSTIRQLIVITALEDAEVVISRGSIGELLKTVKIEKGKSFTYQADSTLMCTASEQVSENGLHVTSTGRIVVTAASMRKASGDSYRIMPLPELGKDYMVIGYDAPSVDQSFTTQFTVIATEPHTTVDLELTGRTKANSRPGALDRIELDFKDRKRISKRIILDQGQTYTLFGAYPSDRLDGLTGTMIHADKSIAVITGHTCAQVPSSSIYCDVLIEMAPPLQRAGLSFIAPAMRMKSGYALRVIATQPSTTVQIGSADGSKSGAIRLNDGEFTPYELIEGNRRIIADKPVFVAQYALSNEADSTRIGDPFMTLLAPDAAFESSVTFVTPPVKGQWHHFASVVCDKEAASTLSLNGETVDSDQPTLVDDNMYVVQLELQEKTNEIKSEGKFAVYNYGFGSGQDNYDSYGTYCGPW